MTDGERSEKKSFLAKAESFLAQNLYQTAQDLALDWLKRFPDDADARVIVCHAWMRMGKLDKVKQMLKEVDEAILGMSRIYARMGDICRQSGLNGEAITFYRRFVALNPDSPVTEEVSEKLQSLLSFHEETIFQEEEVERKRPVPGMQTVTMADLYVKQGHSDLAIELLEEILKKDLTNHRAAAMLKELRTPPEAKAEKEPIRKAAVIRELTRWLNNVDRIRRHAA